MKKSDNFADKHRSAVFVVALSCQNRVSLAALILQVNGVAVKLGRYSVIL